MLETLRLLHRDVQSLKIEIVKEPGPRISKRALRTQAENVAKTWFSSIAPALSKNSFIVPEAIDRYSNEFGTLLKLSRPNNLQTRYVHVLKAILKKFHDDYC